MRSRLRPVACGLLAGGLLPLLPSAAVTPGAGTPMSRIFDQFYRDAMRPLPPLPPAPAPSVANDVWVPDRYVPLPGVPGGAWISGHWEQRMPNGDFHAPPLLGITQDGRLIHIPAGARPPLEHRHGP